MAKVHSEWYGGGDVLPLAPGEQKLCDFPIGSVSVDEHERLVIFHGPTEDNQAPFLYSGWYPETQFRGLNVQSRKLIKCEHVDIDDASLLTVRAVARWSNGHYDIVHRVPPGDYDSAVRYFPNDRIEQVEFSAAGILEVYEHGGYGGRHVSLPPGTYNLSDYNLANQVSSLKYSLDAWEDIGCRFGDIRNKSKIGHSVAAEATVINDHGRALFGHKVSVSHQESASFSWNWSVTAGITVSASVKASTGALPGGEVTAGIEASLSATTGQERSVSYTQDVTRECEVSLDPGDSAVVELLVEHYTAEVDVVQRLRNQRTKQEIEREGTVLCRYSDAHARLAEAA